MSAPVEANQKFVLNAGGSTPLTIFPTPLSIILEGKMLLSSLALNYVAPGASSTSATYTFAYNRDLTNGDKITLLLPHWSTENIITHDMLSHCGVDFTVFTNGLDESFAIIFVVKSGKYFAKTVCSIGISTFTNTNEYTRATKQNFKNAVTSKNGGMVPQMFLE
jgi:hypothetical protein